MEDPHRHRESGQPPEDGVIYGLTMHQPNTPAQGPLARALTCPNCGAPVRWKGQAQVIECRYCRTHVIAQSGIKTQAPATVVSARKPQEQKLILVLAVGLPFLLMVIGGVGMALKGGAGGGSIGGTKPSKVAKVTLETSQAKLHDKLGGRIWKHTLLVPLSEGPFEQIIFRWDEKVDDHVKGISFRLPDKTPMPDKVMARLRKQLGRELRAQQTGGHHFGATSASLSVGSNLHLGANNFEDERWKGQLQALWTATAHAALGRKKKLSAKTRREVLNVDNRIVDLGKVDMDVNVRDAEAAVRKVFPAARTDDASHVVGLGHPWLNRGRLNWKNAADGKLEYVNLSLAPEHDEKAHRAAVVACFTQLYGNPAEAVNDHLKDRRTFNWEATGGVPWVTYNYQAITVYLERRGKRATKDSWRQLTQTLGNCGN